ncbi:bi-domain-containing oxidoreductase [Ignicoccus hospitalis]|uniref:Alcohol dehydrogenase, zinc-binding domain protein n=1 Tax=Ignicoccus hospitalis (strain KIN4/I / DSM 18386 / JCM 14125) TaxID=453591 RepID=A8AA58_IGNH4|nr:bi-domain-containing oxidoreductase [Ignicoccus hospitalis]ABU81810.1 Alcohol dehydrogenase, zinc-binding domain protein [Ignicoccus hospitalis KIN4/I]HIH90079.1 zinc-binding dehydrogenase [Desulfurococcaceae archaeon]
MKAVVIKGSKVSVEEVPPPRVGDNMVLVATAYSAISAGTELASLRAKKVKEGWLLDKLPLPKPVRMVLENPYYARLALQKIREGGLKELLKYYQKAKEVAVKGRFSGYSASGYVIGKGSGVIDVNKGDAVAIAGVGFASHAELNATPRRLAVKIPEGLGLKEASTVALGAIALQGIRRAELHQGDSVAIIGLGLIGNLAAQIAKSYNLKVVGFDINDKRVELARSKGVLAFNSTSVNPVEKVMELTEGFGADAVIIAASSDKPGLIDLALDMLRHRGKVVVLGAFPMQFDRTRMYLKDAEIRISVSYGPGRYDPVYELGGVDYPIGYVRWTEERNMKEYLRLLAEGYVDLEGVVGAVYPVEEAPKAYQDLLEGKINGLTALISYDYEKYLKESSIVSLIEISGGAPAQVVKKGSKPTASFIGFGSFASNVLYPIVKEVFELNGVAVTDPLKAKDLLKKGFKFSTTNYKDVLEREENLIIIATRHSQHYPILKDALLNSKASVIYVEKPPVLTPEQLEEINELVKESGKEVVVGFNRRCSPITQLIKEVVGDRAATLSYRVAAGKLPKDHWVYSPEEGGRYLGEGCHFVDYALAIFEGREALKGSAVFVPPDNASLYDTDLWSSSIAFERALANIVYTSLNPKDVEKELIEVFVEGKVGVKVYDYKRVEFYGDYAQWVKRCEELCSRYSPNAEGNLVTLGEQAKGWREEVEQLKELLTSGRAGCLATWEKAYRSMKVLFSFYY